MLLQLFYVFNLSLSRDGKVSLPTLAVPYELSVISLKQLGKIILQLNDAFSFLPLIFAGAFYLRLSLLYACKHVFDLQLHCGKYRLTVGMLLANCCLNAQVNLLSEDLRLER